MSLPLYALSRQDGEEGGPTWAAILLTAAAGAVAVVIFAFASFLAGFWCITCLVNEKLVLASDEIRTELQDRSIVYMKGDWTNRDPAITRVLEQYGRSGVPLYLYFPGDPERAVTVLPNILTRGIVLQALDQRQADHLPPGDAP